MAGNPKGASALNLYQLRVNTAIEARNYFAASDTENAGRQYPHVRLTGIMGAVAHCF